MQSLIDLARQGKKEEFKFALKEQLNQRRDSFLNTARVAMARSVGSGQKK